MAVEPATIVGVHTRTKPARIKIAFLIFIALLSSSPDWRDFPFFVLFRRNVWVRRAEFDRQPDAFAQSGTNGKRTPQRHRWMGLAMQGNPM